MKYCWAPLCRESDGKKTDVSFHVFPKDFNQRKLWIQAVGRSCEPGKTAVICSKHFRLEDFAHTLKHARLKRDVIPSQFSVVTAQNKSEQIQESQSSTDDPICRRDIAEAAFDNEIQVSNSGSCDRSVSPENLSLPNESDTQNLEQGSRKRKWRPAHLKQVTSEHLVCRLKRAKYWSKAMDEISSLRKKVKVLQEDKRRMSRKISTFNDILKSLEEKQLLTGHASDTIMVPPNIQ